MDLGKAFKDMKLKNANALLSESICENCLKGLQVAIRQGADVNGKHEFSGISYAYEALALANDDVFDAFMAAKPTFQENAIEMAIIGRAPRDVSLHVIETLAKEGYSVNATEYGNGDRTLIDTLENKHIGKREGVYNILKSYGAKSYAELEKSSKPQAMLGV